MTREFLIHLTFHIILIYTLLDSLNIFYCHKLFKRGGLLSYSRIKDDIFLVSYKMIFSIIIKFFFDYPNFIILIALRFIISILLISNIIDEVYIFLILLIQILILYRNEIWLGLADGFSMIIFISLSVYFNFDSIFIKDISIYFISIMTIISYFFTAYYKMKGKLWLNGQALKLILSTDVFGNEKMHYILHKNPKLSILLNHSVILFQLSTFFSILSPKLAIIFICLGFLFHLSISALMNLNNFFWVYISTYPCIYYMSLKINLF